MNLSIQSYAINNNSSSILMQKNSFKGKYLTPEAFAAEEEIIKKINKLPQNVFLECAKFVRFCHSIDITPRITGALRRRLVEVRQTNVNSKNFIA